MHFLWQAKYSGKCFSPQIIHACNSYYDRLSVQINYNNNDSNPKAQEGDVDLMLLKNNCIIDQQVKNAKNDKVVQNLQTIIEKAIKL